MSRNINGLRNGQPPPGPPTPGQQVLPMFNYRIDAFNLALSANDSHKIQGAYFNHWPVVFIPDEAITTSRLTLFDPLTSRDRRTRWFSAIRVHYHASTSLLWSRYAISKYPSQASQLVSKYEKQIKCLEQIIIGCRDACTLALKEAQTFFEPLEGRWIEEKDFDEHRQAHLEAFLIRESGEQMRLHRNAETVISGTYLFEDREHSWFINLEKTKEDKESQPRSISAETSNFFPKASEALESHLADWPKDWIRYGLKMSDFSRGFRLDRIK
jgi:hypothetical protein